VNAESRHRGRNAPDGSPAVGVARAGHRAAHGQVLRFLAVGLASYAIDIGVLYVLHGRASVRLWVATSAAYATGLLVNFGLNRIVTFRSANGVHTELARYVALLVGNYVVTVAFVTGLTAAGSPYLVSKTVCVALLAVVNFLAYRHWVFADRGTTAEDGTAAAAATDDRA
jgi:putative flippase GtrA